MQKCFFVRCKYNKTSGAGAYISAFRFARMFFCSLRGVRPAPLDGTTVKACRSARFRLAVLGVSPASAPPSREESLPMPGRAYRGGNEEYFVRSRMMARENGRRREKTEEDERLRLIINNKDIGGKDNGDSDRTAGSGHRQVQHEGGLHGLGGEQGGLRRLRGAGQDKVRRAAPPEGQDGAAAEVLHGQGHQDAVAHAVSRGEEEICFSS